MRMSMIEIEKAIKEGRDKVLVFGLICPVVKNRVGQGYFSLTDPTDGHSFEVAIEQINGAIIDGVWTVMDERCLRYTATPTGLDKLRPGDEVPHFEHGWRTGTCTVRRVTDIGIQSTIFTWYRRTDGYEMRHIGVNDVPVKADRDGSSRQLVPDIPENAEFFRRSELIHHIQQYNDKLQSLPTEMLQMISDMMETGLAHIRKEGSDET